MIIITIGKRKAKMIGNPTSGAPLAIIIVPPAI
jgi:hypothetical protein